MPNGTRMSPTVFKEKNNELVRFFAANCAFKSPPRHPLEVEYPAHSTELIDADLCSFAFHLPQEVKVKVGCNRSILISRLLLSCCESCPLAVILV